MTSRYERIKTHRRLQRRIRLVVEERRIALAQQGRPVEPARDEEGPSVSTP